MKQLTFLSLFILFIFSTASGQSKKYIYYFDQNMNITAQSGSVFYGSGLKDGNVFELKCFDIAKKYLVFIAHYTDTTLLKLNGLFQSYYEAGTQEKEGNYSSGRQEGLWQTWDSLGNLTDSTLFKDGKKMMQATYSYYKNGTLADHTTSDSLKDILNET